MIKRFEIPPQIFWPGMVFAILGGSVLANVYLLTQASSDGGAQIIDNYYEKAADWDQTKAKVSKANALGWTVSAEVLPAAAGKTIQVKILGADQKALGGLQPTVTLQNPTKVADVSTSEMGESEEPGVYLSSVAFSRSGLWDLVIRVPQGAETYEFKRRVDVRGK